LRPSGPKKRVRAEPSDAASIERHVRQLLADGVSGTMMGLWLLVPEHLRLGTWDLVCQWAGQPGERVEPRLALQLVHEAALCARQVRQRRSLSQKGFEAANGLPFVASDQAIHNLLAAHTVAEAEWLQVAFRARAPGTRPLRRPAPGHRPASRAQLQQTPNAPVPRRQPLEALQDRADLLLPRWRHPPAPCVSPPRPRPPRVSQATPGLLRLAAHILQPPDGHSLVLADTEHYTAQLIDHVHDQTPFDLLVPIPKTPKPPAPDARPSPTRPSPADGPASPPPSNPTGSPTPTPAPTSSSSSAPASEPTTTPSAPSSLLATATKPTPSPSRTRSAGTSRSSSMPTKR